jgi:hypothetical protein
MSGGKEVTMSRIGATLAILFMLLASHAGAQPADMNYSLDVPLRGTLEASVARVAGIVEGLGGNLQTAKGEDTMIAAWPDGRRLAVVQKNLYGTPTQTLLNLSCSNTQDSAKAMCDDIAQRYKTGR